MLHIFSPKVLSMIRSGEAGWEEMVPPYVDTMIKDNRLFGYRPPEEERSKAGKAGAKA